MAFKSPTMHKLHVWLWIVDQKRLATVIDLYGTQIKCLYNTFHITYLSYKIKDMTAFSKARRNK